MRKVPTHVRITPVAAPEGEQLSFANYQAQGNAETYRIGRLIFSRSRGTEVYCLDDEGRNARVVTSPATPEVCRLIARGELIEFLNDGGQDFYSRSR